MKTECACGEVIGIEFRPRKGANIEKVAKRVVEIATDSNLPVLFQFNGVKFRVMPLSTVNDVFDAYHNGAVE